MRTTLSLILAAFSAAPVAAATTEGLAPHLVLGGDLRAVQVIRPEAAVGDVSLPMLPAAVVPGGAAIITAPDSVPGRGTVSEQIGVMSTAVSAISDAASKGGVNDAATAGASIQATLTGENTAVAASSDSPMLPGIDKTADLATRIAQARALMHGVVAEVGRVIIGQIPMKKGLLFAVTAKQHNLIEGMPGDGKTDTAKATADAVGGVFQRVQGTPDKLPSDILGTEVLVEDPTNGKKYFELIKGPIFADILLVDEINRMPPRTQAALLEAMAEGQVTIGRQTIKLLRNTVIATQNPVEQDGTYRLPEAQLDRFMNKTIVSSPTEEELIRIGRLKRAKEERPKARQVTTLAQLDDVRRIAEKLPVTEDVERYAAKLAMGAYVIMQKEAEEAKKSGGNASAKTIDYSVYTRAYMDLITAASLNAIYEGRDHVNASDIHDMAVGVLRHRVAMSFSANMTADEFIKTMLTQQPRKDDSAKK